MQGYVEVAIAKRGSPDDKIAIGDSVSHAAVDLRLLEDVTRSNGGPGFVECGLIRIHQPKLSKPEIAHSPSSGADVQRIPGRDQHDPKLVAQLLFQVSVTLQALFVEPK
jgi:hypothetical protein